MGKEDDRRSGKGTKSFEKSGVGDLGGKVFTYGVAGQKERYMSTTRAIADYVGRTYGKEMWKLVQEREETKFEEPDDPGDQATKAALEKYKMLLKMSLDDMKQYKQNKAKVFRIVMGQCVTVMRNKIEGLSDYQDLVDKDDVIGLLNKIRELVYSMENVQYEYWTMQASIKNLLNLKQQEKESLASYCKRFLEQQEVTEEIWGAMIPMKMKGKLLTEQDEARNRFLACVFLAGVDRNKYKTVLDDLNNDFVLGTVNYPEDIAGMMTLLSNRRGGGVSDRKLDAIRDGASESSFAQYSEKLKCWKCGETGHTKRNCTKNSKKKQSTDDEAEESDGSATESEGGRSSRSKSSRSRGSDPYAGAWAS
jgi:Zinc knuckle